MLTFSDECAATDAQLCLNIKSYSDLLNVSSSRDKMAFWCKYAVFEYRIFSKSIFFQITFNDFQQEYGLLALLLVKKGQSLLFTSKKVAGLIFDF